MELVQVWGSADAVQDVPEEVCVAQLAVTAQLLTYAAICVSQKPALV